MEAQTEKGGWTFGASSSISFASSSQTPEYNGTSGEKTKFSEFSIAPNVGYFVADNFAVGAELGFSSSKEDDFKSSSTLGALTGTYFFGSEEFRPYAGVGIGYMGLSNEFSSPFGTSEIKFGGLIFGGKLGVAYFVTDSVSLNLQADYLNSNLSYKDDNNVKIKGNTISLSLGFAIYL